MGKHAKEARCHEERIQYFHDHAGTAGYAQAEPHFARLGELIQSAQQSKNAKEDAAIVQAIRESCTVLIETMRRTAEVAEKR